MLLLIVIHCSIESLNLAVNNLHGNVSIVLSTLKKLKKLYLFYNPLVVGNLPDIDLPNLRCLDIRGTGISGKIPSRYFNLTMLLLPAEYMDITDFGTDFGHVCTKINDTAILYSQEEGGYVDYGDKIDKQYMRCIKKGEEIEWKAACLDTYT